MHTVDHALVLREVNYKESDKILTVLTRENGKMTLSARGCRRRGSPIAAACQLLTWSEMTLYEYRGRWGVKEAAAQRQFDGLRGDLEKLALGCYFAELAEALTLDEVPSPEILSLLLNSLHVLERLDRPAALVKAAFELKLMCLSGYEPALGACALCGAEPAQPRLRLLQGELRCAPCREAGEAGVSMPLSPAALAAMRHIAGGEAGRLFSFRLSPPSLKLLGDACEAYVLTQLERSFSTLDYYKSLPRP